PPGATPTSVMLRASGRPNAPGAPCPAQKSPSPALKVDVPVVRFGSTAVNAPRKRNESGGQSSEVCRDPTAVHGWPALSPPSHVPLIQRGHGSAPFGLKYTRLDNTVARLACGGDRSTLPHRSVRNVLMTQADSAPLNTGIGGPK